MNYKTIPIIKVQPIDEYFTLTWQVDLRCNFDCMYCPPNFHDLTSPVKTLDELKNAWLKVFEASKNKNLKYKICFTGGEVSINKDFLPFVTWIRSNYDEYIFQIGVSTNGSASKMYYENLIKQVDFISFSTHSEFFNEKKFFSNVLHCQNLIKETNKTIQVNIMEEPWHSERIKIYARFLENNKVSYSINKIDFSQKIRPYPQLNPSKQFYEF